MDLFKQLASLSFIIFTFGCGSDSNSKNPPIDKIPPQQNLIPQDVQNDLPPVEQILVNLADKSLDARRFQQNKHWTTKGRVKILQSVRASARGNVETFAINAVKKINDNEYLVSIESKVLVSILNVTYHMKDLIRASISNVKLPTTLTASLYVRWKESKETTYEFIPGADGRFLSNLSIYVTSFEYEDTFLRNIPQGEATAVKQRTRNAIDNILRKKNDSIIAKIDTDLNKLSKKDKIDVVALVQKVAKRLEALKTESLK